jgi:hypothetical protein
VAEYIMSANKLPGVKQERTNDRLGALVFSTWGKISVKEKTKKEVEVIVRIQNFPLNVFF